MPPSTSPRLQQGPTHVTDTGRCPTPCPNLTEVARLRQLLLCCSRLGASPSSRACLVLFPALWLSRAAVCAATELLVRCSQDLFDLRTPSVLCPDRQGEPVVTDVEQSNHDRTGCTRCRACSTAECTATNIVIAPIARACIALLLTLLLPAPAPAPCSLLLLPLLPAHAARSCAAHSSLALPSLLLPAPAPTAPCS